jgi:hypothetical protein
LGWSLDRDLNYEFRKPALLAPLLGAGGLGPTRKRWNDFSPVLGLAWAPSPDSKTVVRAGAGFFITFSHQSCLTPNAPSSASLGLGRSTFAGSSILNMLPGIPSVPVGTALDFTTAPTAFRGADLLAMLPAIRAEKTQALVNADPGLQTIQVNKQSPARVSPPDYSAPSALHLSLGVQREIARDFVLTADIAYRHFVHLSLGALDLNHYLSSRGPVIPRCVGAQRNDPQALCSTGPIAVEEGAALATYKGLLLRADKRFSHGF